MGLVDISFVEEQWNIINFLGAIFNTFVVTFLTKCFIDIVNSFLWIMSHLKKKSLKFAAFFSIYTEKAK